MKISFERKASGLLLTVDIPKDAAKEQVLYALHGSDGQLWDYAEEGSSWRERKVASGWRFQMTLIGPWAVDAGVRWAKRLPGDVAWHIEYERRLKGNLATKGIERKELPVYPTQYIADGVEQADFAAFEAAVAEPDAIFELGSFALSGPAMRVTDPCYEKTSDSAGTLQAVPGTWFASVLVGNTSWLRRVKELRVHHEGAPAEVFDQLDQFKEASFTVGVDSGQAGFFDELLYPDGDPSETSAGAADDDDIVILIRDEQGPVTETDLPASATTSSAVSTIAEDPDDLAQAEVDDEGENGPGTFYEQCCTLIGDEQLPGGGVIPLGFGAVSRSGFGDGGYRLRVLSNENGQAVAAFIQYIGDELAED